MRSGFQAAGRFQEAAALNGRSDEQQSQPPHQPAASALSPSHNWTPWAWPTQTASWN
ncbi:hypothetical protein PtA15_12A425, partial [Puccinia triticina]